MNKKVLILGSSGFLGSKVGKLLENRGFLIDFCDLEKKKILIIFTIWKYLISLNLRNLTLLNMI